MLPTTWRPDALYKVFDPERGGIFTALAKKGVPWSSTYDGEVLDDLYIMMYSGSKRPSAVVSRMALETEGYLTNDQVDRLASMIWTANKDAWSRLWALELSQYDPISNYDMEETLTDDTREKEDNRISSTAYGKTNTRTDDLTDTYGTSDTRTDNLTLSRTGTDTTSGTSSGQTSSDADRWVYGLNSSDGVPSDKEEGSSTTTETQSETLTHATTDTHSGTQTNARTGSDTHTGTRSEVSGGTDRMTDTVTSSETHSYRLSRKGNIGVMTTQDMIKQERELHEWKLFYDRVFPDVDRALTLSVY